MNYQKQIVDVKLPSGFVFKFEKPTLLGMLTAGILPRSIANDAVNAWARDGVGHGAELVVNYNVSAEEQKRRDAEIVEAMQRKIVELSYAPKIVFENADRSKSEILYSALSEKDISFLGTWFLTGGEDCEGLRLWANDHQKVLEMVLIADGGHTSASRMMKIENEIVAYEIDSICMNRKLIYEGAKRNAKARLDHYVQMAAAVGEELELDDDSAESAWERKLAGLPEADDILGRATEAQKEKWKREGYEVW